jgi:hypothetical protein
MTNETLNGEISREYLSEVTSLLNDPDVNSVIPEYLKNKVEIVLADEKYIYVYSPFERITEQISDFDCEDGYKLYRYDQKAELWNTILKDKQPATACIQIKELLETSGQGFRFNPQLGEDIEMFPNIYIPIKKKLNGYPVKDVVMEEILHIDDMQYYQWDTRKQFDECLYEESKEYLLQRVREKYSLSPESAQRIGDDIAERSVIGELYPSVIIYFILKNVYRGKQFLENKESLVQAIKTGVGLDKFPTYERSHLWSEVLFDALKDEIDRFNDLEELKEWFRNLYKISK